MVHGSRLGNEDRVRVTGVFASDELETAYRLRHAPQDRFFGRVIVVSAAITTIMLGAIDYQIFPSGPELTCLWAARGTFFVLSWVALYFLRGEPRPAAFERLLGAWYCLSVALHVYIGCVWPAGHIEFRMTAALAVIMSYCIFPLSLRLQTFGAGLYTASSLFVAWMNPPNDFSSTLSDLSWLVLLNILGGFLSYRLHARQRMLFAALQRQSDLSASLRKPWRKCGRCVG